jgi:nucleotidyltransferase/DNA polymerase involved in DNA repair
MQKSRFIVHVDMDAFFASIEQRDDPSFRSKPVVVGSDPKRGKGRGVVSTCSYEARSFGIHSAMPISAAYRACPHAIFLPVDMEKYERVSSEIREILYSFTPDIEPISIDEAFLDITGSHHLFGTPLETCRLIKSRIKDRAGLTASVGLAPTKMAAKIASDLRKPDGLVCVTAKGLLDFLWPLDIRRIWGLGPKAENALHSIGVRTIGDLAKADPADLKKMFGKNGVYFRLLANGIDAREISAAAEARSISNEHTFSEDTEEAAKIERAIMRLSEKVSARLRADGLQCRTVTLKIRLTGFQTYTRSITMPLYTNFADALYKEAKALYNKFERGGKPVRLIGVKASGIARNGSSAGLFEYAAGDKQEKLHTAIDAIQNKFGEGYICHATSMALGDNRKRG